MPARCDTKYIDGELWVRVRDCPECKKVHETLPIVRSYHSPCCTRFGKCAECGTEIASGGRAFEVGELCTKCYFGDAVDTPEVLSGV
jgi:hypothetical protein